MKSKRHGRERGPVARLEYPFVRCEHRAGPALPGYALCRHLLDPKRLPPVVCIELHLPTSRRVVSGANPPRSENMKTNVLLGSLPTEMVDKVSTNINGEVLLYSRSRILGVLYAAPGSGPVAAEASIEVVSVNAPDGVPIGRGDLIEATSGPERRPAIVRVTISGSEISNSDCYPPILLVGCEQTALYAEIGAVREQ